MSVKVAPFARYPRSMTDLEAAWAAVHENTPDGWYVEPVTQRTTIGVNPAMEWWDDTGNSNANGGVHEADH